MKPEKLAKAQRTHQAVAQNGKKKMRVHFFPSPLIRQVMESAASRLRLGSCRGRECRALFCPDEWDFTNQGVE